MNEKDVLALLSEDPLISNITLKILNDHLSKINLPTKTMGGTIFWTTIAEVNGYKFQQNRISCHARIIDNNNVRLAWGSMAEMKEAMNIVIQKYSEIKEAANAADNMASKVSKIYNF